MKSNFQLFKKLSDSAKAELQRREQINRHSIENEALNIIEAALSTPKKMGFGDKLAAIGRFYQVEEKDIEFIESMRNRTPAKPMKFD